MLIDVKEHFTVVMIKNTGTVRESWCTWSFLSFLHRDRHRYKVKEHEDCYLFFEKENKMAEEAL